MLVWILTSRNNNFSTYNSCTASAVLLIAWQLNFLSNKLYITKKTRLRNRDINVSASKRLTLEALRKGGVSN